jgi:hypothetical protein
MTGMDNALDSQTVNVWINLVSVNVIFSSVKHFQKNRETFLALE